MDHNQREHLKSATIGTGLTAAFATTAASAMAAFGVDTATIAATFGAVTLAIMNTVSRPATTLCSALTTAALAVSVAHHYMPEAHHETPHTPVTMTSNVQEIPLAEKFSGACKDVVITIKDSEPTMMLPSSSRRLPQHCMIL